MNITYANGTFINSTNFRGLTLNKSQINADGIYNISLFCNSTNSTSYARGWFNVSDTTLPTITWITPNDLGTDEADRYSTFPVEVIVSDVNLYRFNVSCISSYGISMLFSNYVYPNATIYDYQGTTSNLTTLGAITCTACVQDSHTALNIKDIPYYQENGSMIFGNSDEINLKISYTDNKVKDVFTIIKDKDRYKFEPKTKLEVKDVTTLSYEVECIGEDLKYFNKSSYPAHFLCGEYWIDFDMQGMSKKNYKITKLVGELYRVDITFNKGQTSLMTKSVGIINTVCDTNYLTVVTPTTATTGNNVSISFIELAMVLIWIFLFSTGFMIPAVSIFAGLWGLFLGFLIVLPFSVGLSILFIFLNIAYVYFVLSKI
jgi:hypothetical protein